MTVVFIIGFFVVLAMVVGLIGVSAQREARRAAHRWGAESALREDATGDGAFRTAPLSDVRPRRIPFLVRFVGLAGAMLSMLTPVALAPLVAGFGFSIIEVEGHGALGLFAFFVSCLLFVGSVFVHRTSVDLLKNELGAGEAARPVGAAIAVVCGPSAVVLSAATQRLPDMAAACSLWLGVLFCLGVGLAMAGGRVARLQAAMSDEEIAALRRPVPRR